MSFIKAAFLMTIIAAAVSVVFNLGMAFADVKATPMVEPTEVYIDPFAGLNYNDVHALAEKALVTNDARDYETLFELAQELNYQRATFFQSQENGHPHQFMVNYGGPHQVPQYVYNLTLNGNGLTLEHCYYDAFASGASACWNVPIAE